MRARSGRTAVATAMLLLGCLLISRPAAAQSPLLSDQRWYEDSYGLSLRLPVESRMIDQRGDEALLRLTGQPDYTMAVYLRASEWLVDMEKVQQFALEQVAAAYPAAVILDQRTQTIQDQPSATFVFLLPADASHQRRIVGQTFVQVDPTALAVIHLEAPERHRQTVLPIFEAVIDNLQFDDVEQLARRRNEAIVQGEAWLLGLDARTLHAAIVPDQWFRILEHGQDVGYMHVTQQADEAVEHTGIRIDVQSRVHGPEYVTDTLSNFFLSDDLLYEVWSMRTTVRPRVALRSNIDVTQESSWAETGLRSGEIITVTREGPAGKHEFHWQQPQAYLSQVAAYLLGPILARPPAGQSSDPLGFYAYYPNRGKISYRTERITTHEDGTFTLTSRPTPEYPEQISTYDHTGQLIERIMPGGWTILPATSQQIAARWNVRPSR